MTEAKSGGVLPALAGVGLGVVLLGAMLASVQGAVKSAAERLKTPEANKPAVAIADHAEAPYCTAQFKQVLERVLHSCGLMGNGFAAICAGAWDDGAGPPARGGRALA